MIKTLLNGSGTAPLWIDIVSPTQEELQQIASQYGLHAKMVEDCLDPEHLPKFELINDKSFLIVRALDSQLSARACTVQGLTRKVALFFSRDFLVTIHRVPLSLLDGVAQKWTSRSPAIPELVADVLNASVASYERPLETAENAVDRFEQTLFSNREVLSQLKSIHLLKRQVSVYRRMLWYTNSAIQKLEPVNRSDAPFYQDLRENIDAQYLHADELLEDINALLNIHLAIASHRTNEVVRLLTLFSVFFLPLTFIAGVYGMNFKIMPELDWKWGYPATLIVMSMVSGLIYVWFRKKGFLK